MLKQDESLYCALSTPVGIYKFASQPEADLYLKNELSGGWNNFLPGKYKKLFPEY